MALGRVDRTSDRELVMVESEKQKVAEAILGGFWGIELVDLDA